MKNVFEALKECFGVGTQPMYYHQTKAKRVAAAAAYIAQKVFWKMPLRMSVIDIYNSAVIYSAQPEKEEQYNGWINMIRERIEISEIQEELISGKITSIEAEIIRMAETMIELRYSGGAREELSDFLHKLEMDDKVSGNVLSIIGSSAIKYWWEYEEMLQIEVERNVMH